MKTLQNLTKVAFLFIALFAGTAAFAQDSQGGRPTPEARAEMQLKRYEKQLELTPDQSTKIRAILLSSVQEAEKLRTAGAGVNREAMQAQALKRSEDIRAVLTPAQQEKFAQILSNQMERGGQGQGQGRQGGQGGARRANSQGNN